MAAKDIQVHSLIENLSGVQIFRLSLGAAAEITDERIILPHRHDHYCCFFCEEGDLNFNIDFRSVQVAPSSLLVSCPGQVHQLGHANQVAGWVIAFDARLIDLNARMVIEQSFADIVLLNLTTSDRDWFAYIFDLVYAASAEKNSGTFQAALVQSLMNAFFYKVVNLFQQQQDQQVQGYSLRSIEIARTFQQLIKEHFLTLKKPAEYAFRMNITVSYLNDTVKSVTGFSSTYLIQQEILREAQRLLFYTASNVKEIAFQLGYQDHKYFIRLFGKMLGASPARFRGRKSPEQQFTPGSLPH